MRKVIYTATFGKYDHIRVPTKRTEGWDYIAFTDSHIEANDHWHIIQCESEKDSIRAARKRKILCDKYLPDYDLSIWVDANIIVNTNLDIFVERYLHSDLAIMKHPTRQCAYDEAAICVAANKGQETEIQAQMQRYSKEGYPRGAGLTASGIMIRNHHKTTQFLEDWWAEVQYGSTRDQLSFNYVYWKNPVDINLISYQILRNEMKYTKHG